jgi:hypothetical protein
MFVETGKRWLRALWNCELRGALAAGFLVRGFLGTIYAHRISKQSLSNWFEFYCSFAYFSPWLPSGWGMSGSRHLPEELEISAHVG